MEEGTDRAEDLLFDVRVLEDSFDHNVHARYGTIPGRRAHPLEDSLSRLGLNLEIGTGVTLLVEELLPLADHAQVIVVDDQDDDLVALALRRVGGGRVVDAVTRGGQVTLEAARRGTDEEHLCRVRGPRDRLAGRGGLHGQLDAACIGGGQAVNFEEEKSQNPGDTGEARLHSGPPSLR